MRRIEKMARETVAKTDYYLFEVDPDINRLFLTLRGFWENPSVAPNVLKDMDAALDKVRPGFTNLVDTTQFKTPPKDVMEVFERVQQRIMARGISKNAEVVSSAFVEVNLEEVASQSDLSKVLRQFKSMADALAWLNE
jgi:DNA-binding transcriptional regulator GbsR (MarR family)